MRQQDGADCRPPPPSPSPPPAPPPGAPAGPPPHPVAPSAWRRFEFADGNDGEWGPAVSYSQAPLWCAAGAIVVFQWHNSSTDLVRLSSEQAWESCDVSGATTIAPRNMAGQLHLTCEAGQRYFLTTSAAAECRAGQKLRVFASGSVFAHDPNSGETLLHVLSMDRVYTLLGHRDSGLGFSELSRGYQTEELAASTLELIWCLDASGR